VTIPDSLTEPHGAGEAGPVAGDAAASAEAAAPEGGGGGGGVFACAPLGTATFCDDFDHGPPLATWNTIVQGAGYGASVVSDVVDTPPGALFAHVDSTVTDDCAYGRVEKEIPGAFHRVRLAVSVRADGPSSLGNEAIATFGVSQADRGLGCQTLVEFQWTGASYALELSEQTSQNSKINDQHHETPILIPAGTFQRVDIEMDYTAKTLIARDTGGVVIYQDTLRLDCTAAPGAADVDVGFHCSQASTLNRQMHADNVVFDAE
jgi:hypothetical protein